MNMCEAHDVDKFQHTAARRRLTPKGQPFVGVIGVSTHSRPKAADVPDVFVNWVEPVSTHSRPKAAEWYAVITA